MSEYSTEKCIVLQTGKARSTIGGNSLYKSFEKGIVMIQEVFDLKRYLHCQSLDALLCPINREMTRREHECDDWALLKNPGWLMIHYEANGGAVAFAKRRAEFIRKVEVPDIPEEDYMI